MLIFTGEENNSAVKFAEYKVKSALSWLIKAMEVIKAVKSRTVNVTSTGWLCYLHWSPKPNNQQSLLYFLLCRHWRNVHNVFLIYIRKIKLFPQGHTGKLSYLFRSTPYWWARSKLQGSDSKRAKCQVQHFFFLSFLMNYGNLIYNFIFSIYEAFTRLVLKTYFLMR